MNEVVENRDPSHQKHVAGKNHRPNKSVGFAGLPSSLPLIARITQNQVHIAATAGNEATGTMAIKARARAGINTSHSKSS
jgi:hypothetical protein